MDPNETLRMLCQALVREDIDEAAEAADNLYEWINGGGFSPSVTDFQLFCLVISTRTLLNLARKKQCQLEADA